MIIKALDDRNYLSHIYYNEEFQSIYNNIQDYIGTFQLVAEKIKT